jgi:hypothetical protein
VTPAGVTFLLYLYCAKLPKKNHVPFGVFEELFVPMENPKVKNG